MNHYRQAIVNEIEKNLQVLEPERAAVFRSVLYANLDRGRVETFIGNDLNCVGDYVQRVVEHHARLSSYIKSVQSERSDAVWLPLFQKLQMWAYNFLLRKNFAPGDSTRVVAEECATEAALRILDAYFPYDTDFDPWAHTIITITCLRFFRDGTKKSLIPAQNIVELDDELPDLENGGLLDPDNKNDLLEAMSGLSDARCQVIQLHYLEDMPLPEIAKVMGKTVGAVHSLHFNALQDLRKILSKNRNNT